jgi:hypothetical protein
MTIGPYENSPTPDQQEMAGYHHPKRVGYEHSNASVSGIFWFCVWFVVIGAIIHVIVWYVYRDMTHDRQQADIARSALAGDRPSPPEPRLQPTISRTGDANSGHPNMPWQDWGDMLRDTNAEFMRRGWEIDGETQQPKIPQPIVEQVARQTAPGAVQPNQAPAIPAAPNR